MSVEDVPLSEVRAKLQEKQLSMPIAHRRKKRTIKPKRYSSSSEDDNYSTDDSVRDPLFKLKKTDFNSSDSDSNDDIKVKKKQSTKEKKTYRVKDKKLGKTNSSIQTTNCLKSRSNMWKAAAPSKNIIRDKDWKKKPSTLNKRKRITPGRPKQLKTKQMSSKIESAKKSLFKSPQKNMPLRSPNKSLSDAKRRSLLTYRTKQLIYRMHKRTLDTILASNGFKRINIEGDGNCFFAAVCASNPDLDASKLRQDICLHMQENAPEYIDFIPSNTEISNEEKKDIFQEQVNYLKQEGNWSNELGDTLPLAVSNYLKREIMIISSNRNKPVLRIQPTIGKTLDDSLITLAYLAIPGSEHYDACIPLDKNISNNQPDKANSESRPPKTPDKQTPKKQGGKMSSGFNITPRKQADYISPKKKTRTRKRKAVPAEWKKNIRKRLRLSGKEYTNTRGKLVEAKSVKDQDCSKCRYKCSTKISEEERREIFNNYWSLQDYKRQRDYICSSILQASPKRIRPKAKNPRKITRQFSFVNKGAQVRVCKTFFLKTLDIGEKTVEYALKSNSHKTFSSQDKRGRHVPHNLTPEPSMEHVRRHIESFPVMDPHYTRKDTRRKFLGSDLNISKMYRLYKDECVQNRRKPVGAGKYRKVFCEEYNFSFHTPKKDQCQLCALYYQKEKEGNLSDELKKRYEDHIQRKNKARDEKSSDKAYAKSNPAYHCATFDLQSVLHTPCSNVSQVYYKRKLNCYNLSVYSLGNSDATCFMWNETEGKRGSNEIGTCLLMYIRSLPITLPDNLGLRIKGAIRTNSQTPKTSS
ncbi:hypothetical protein FSP39_001017 [Pinctada imbricata]|uniref:OTU domain-containing protein n=1 Tax=Pinctada imbricata TaxID=66713 RepID=A0AA88XPV0_PINIB|nr:hypothetical protein FSP39_001017 [Pinctada imbricata]